MGRDIPGACRCVLWMLGKTIKSFVLRVSDASTCKPSGPRVVAAFSGAPGGSLSCDYGFVPGARLVGSVEFKGMRVDLGNVSRVHTEMVEDACDALTVPRTSIPIRPGVCQSAKSVRRRLWRATCEMAQRRVEGLGVVVVVAAVQDDVWGWSESWWQSDDRAGVREFC